MSRLRALLVTLFCLLPLIGFAKDPVSGMLERICPGASKQFVIQLKGSPDAEEDYFELESRSGKIIIRGNSYVNIATGLNWYLKYYAGVNLSWNCMTATLPQTLPAVPARERHSTTLKQRYDFNYCTFSYSMAFWGWEEWEREIDWMALHGINLPLAAVGAECVWRNFFLRLGYTDAEIERIIAGPAFLAWFEMNNIEGWGGPLPKEWYETQEDLQRKILERCRQWGMKPVLPGYSGMVPHDADEKLGLEISDPGLWNGLLRPCVLNPEDEHFAKIADIYYEEQEKLFGKADYYSMDPFHETATSGGVDFAKAGAEIMKAMKKRNPKAVWVLQAWSENPRDEMIESLGKGDLLVLDLFSECRPMWGMESIWKKPNGFGEHDWLFCLLENFGARVGLHGRMDQLIENFYLTKSHPMAKNIKGIGLTMEGSGNNPVIFELMSELPWREERFTKEEWIKDYCFARYGVRDERLEKAWSILASSIYNCPRGNNQQGCHESIFCARPSQNAFWVYERSKLENYYAPEDTRRAAELFLDAAPRFKGNDNFEYDLVDIVRQAIADRGRIIYQRSMADYRSYNLASYRNERDAFLRTILVQNELLSSRPEFMVGPWISSARALGRSEAQKDLYEFNARVQITTWAGRECANKGKLHDYAHKEWNGLLKDFYYPRWKKFYDTLDSALEGTPLEEVDWYEQEKEWALQRNPYPVKAQTDPVLAARKAYDEVFSMNL